MKKILFTGSLGFIFSNFIRKAAFEKAEYIFCGVDKAVTPSHLNNVYYNKIISSNYLSDITDQHIVNNIFEIEKPDIVIHAASYHPNINSTSEIKECFNTNVIGTQILLEACKKYNISKFIYLSSDKLYQPISLGNENSLLKETDMVAPDSPLSISQLAAEQLIKTSGVNYNILRIGNVYGPRQNKDSIFVNTFKAIKNKEPIVVDGDGLQVFDWMHVFDLSSALLTILKSDVNYQIINISSKQECSVIEFIQFICNSMKDGHQSYIFNKKRIVHARYAMDNSKLLSLGWKPNVKLKSGVEETCNWMDLNLWALK